MPVEESDAHAPEARSKGAVTGGRLTRRAVAVARNAASVGREAAASAVGSTAGTARWTAIKSTELARSGSAAGAGAAASVARHAADAARAAAAVTDDASSTAAAVTVDASKAAARTTKRAGAAASAAARWTARKPAELAAAAQAMLGGGLDPTINALVAGAVDGPATVYDRAMDARYLDPLLRSEMGGSYHRLFDGGHTVLGAAKAGAAASPDDSIIQQAAGTIQGLLRDGTTERGLPLATWDKDTFDAVASNLDIPKRWLYEVNTYDVADVFTSSVGAVAVVWRWNKADTDEFAMLASGTLMSAGAAINPLLCVVGVVALARAYHISRHEPDGTKTLIDGAAKGAVGAGTTLAAMGLLVGAGAPAAVTLLTGVTVGVVVRRATHSVSVVEISGLAAKQAQALVADLRLRTRTGSGGPGTETLALDT